MEKNLAEGLGRVRWKCRRGMLELDLMLLEFFNTHCSQMTHSEMKDFELLLESPDPVLQEYLYGISVPDHPGVYEIIKKIRK